MSTLVIYGTAASRTVRTLWMAKELGLAFEHVPVDFRKGEAKAPEYLRVNPNARIPAIKDGDLVLWESLAINLYLAKKHPGPLTPESLEDEARAIQWSMWALTEIEPHAVTLLVNRVFLPEDRRDEAAAGRAAEALAAPLGVLDAHLAGRDHLLGGRFTVADLNVAAVAGALVRAKFDLSPHPRVATWLETCSSRPAAIEARRMAG